MFAPPNGKSFTFVWSLNMIVRKAALSRGLGVVVSVLAVVSAVGCSPDAPNIADPAASRTASSPILAGQHRITRWTVRDGALEFRDGAVGSPSDAPGRLQQKPLALTDQAKASLSRRIAQDPVMALLSRAVLDGALASEGKHVRSFSLMGSRKIHSQIHNGAHYTVESVLLGRKNGKPVTALFLKKNGRLVGIRRVLNDQVSGDVSTILSIDLSDRGSILGISLTESASALTVGQDATATDSRPTLLLARQPTGYACPVEEGAFLTALGIWIAHQAELAVLAAGCVETLIMCQPYWDAQQQAIQLDIALALAYIAYDNCLHRISNDRTPGHMNAEGKFCYFVIYYESIDGGVTWEETDRREICAGEYME